MFKGKSTSGSRQSRNWTQSPKSRLMTSNCWKGWPRVADPTSHPFNSRKAPQGHKAKRTNSFPHFDFFLAKKRRLLGGNFLVRKSRTTNRNRKHFVRFSFALDSQKDGIYTCKMSTVAQSANFSYLRHPVRQLPCRFLKFSGCLGCFSFSFASFFFL